MSDDIECAFTGKVGTDPVMRTTKAGKAWLGFSVAVGTHDATQWVQVALFGDGVAETAARLAKGDRVYVEGKIKLNAWTDANGKERSGLSAASFHLVPLGQIGRKRPKGDRGRGEGSARLSAGGDRAGPKISGRERAMRSYAAPSNFVPTNAPSAGHLGDNEIPF